MAVFGGLGHGQSALLPLAADGGKIGRQGFWGAAEANAASLGGGDALCLTFADVLTLILSYER